MPESAKEQVVSFKSAGLRLHGVLGVAEDLHASERRAAFLVLHGFGSNSDSTNVLQPTRVLNDFGHCVSTCAVAARARVNSAA